MMVTGKHSLGLCALLALGCGSDGAAGERGPRGESGNDGESAVLASREADDDECPAGGYVLTVGVGDETDEIVVCHGADGTDGMEGPPGPAGDAGPQAAPSIGAIEGTIYCGAALENTDSMWFYYWAVVFSDGSVHARANITNGVNDSSGSLLYAPWQAGALTAAITVTFDVQGPTVGGWWKIELNRETLVVEITYNDVDVEGGEMTWTLQPSENNCVVTARED